MIDPRKPDYPIVDDDVQGHAISSNRVQPPRDEAGDVHGHAHGVKPQAKHTPDDAADDEGDVDGHVYVRPEEHSRTS